MGMGLVLNMDVLSPDEIVVDILIGKIVGTSMYCVKGESEKNIAWK
jgi:hypothetical protein